MSLDRQKSIRKRMFKYGGKIVWAASDEAARKLFNDLLKEREAYRKAGGKFGKK